MHVITRTFKGKGAAELVGLLSSRKGEVEKLMREVPGLVSYDFVQTGDGCFSVTVCKDKAGTDRSLAVALDWLKANAGHLGLDKPIVAEGKSVIHLGADIAAASH